MKGSDWAWRTWGQEDPYFAVLTHERFRSDVLDEEAKRSFFASGRSDIATILTTIERHFAEPPELRRALDFGCGVGRLTLALAAHCHTVTGVDVSPAMLREARRNAAAHEVDNARFEESDDELSRAPGPYDLIVSHIVFQHIPTDRGMRLARRLLERLAPGGVAALQFTYRRPGGLKARLEYWLRHHTPLSYELAARLRRPGADPPMQMNEYDLNELTHCFHRAGIHELVSELTNHGGILGAWLIGQKPA